MRRHLSLVLVLCILAFATSGCGGKTGLEVRVDVPPAMEPGRDFDTIFVQVESSGETAGSGYAVQTSTPRPYYVYVFVDESRFFQAKVTASLKLKGAVKSSATQTADFEEGEILSLAMSMPAPQ